MEIEINRAQRAPAKLGIVSGRVLSNNDDDAAAIAAAWRVFSADARDPRDCLAEVNRWRAEPQTELAAAGVTWLRAARAADMAATRNWPNPDAGEARLVIVEEAAESAVERAEPAKAPEQAASRPTLASGLARAVAGYRDPATHLAVARQLLEEVVEAHKLDRADNPPKELNAEPGWVGALVSIIEAFLGALDKPA